MKKLVTVLTITGLIAACAGVNYFDNFLSRDVHVKFAIECGGCHAGLNIPASDRSFLEFIVMEPHIGLALKCIDCHVTTTTQSEERQ